MAIRMRYGLEAEFNPSKMVVGEWAVSTDSRFVRMCFAPGIVLRMATYESFESDMEQIKSILSEAKSIQSAISRIQSEVNAKAALTIEYSKSAKEYADTAHEEAERAKMYAENAEAVTSVGIATQGRAGLMRGGDNYVDESGALELTRTTTSTTIPNTHAGGVKVNEIRGKSVQGSTTGAQLLNATLPSTTSNGVTCDSNGDGTYTLNGTATENVIFTLANIDLTKIEGDLKLVGCPKGGNNSTYKLNLWQIAIDNDFGNGIIIENTRDLNAEARITIYSGTTCNNLVFKPMVTNNLDATYDDYEPYTGNQPSPNPEYPQEIKKVVVSEIKTHGKNFLNSTITSTTYKNITFTVDSADKSITMNGEATERVDRVLGTAFLRKGATYKVKGMEGASSSTFAIWSSATGSVYSTEKSFSVEEDGAYSFTIVVFAGAKLSNTVVKPIVYEGNITDDTYKPYTEHSITLSEPIELNGIGDVADVITPEAEKQKVGVFKLPATFMENFQGRFYIMSDLPALFNGNTTTEAVFASSYLCTHFVSNYDAFGENDDNQIQFYIRNSDSKQRIFINSSKFNSVDEFNEFLSNNDVYLYYPLAEEVVTPLPTVDQIALHSLMSYDGVTHIYCDSENPAEIEVEVGTSKVGAYTLEALNTAHRNEINYSELTSALLALNQE